MPTYNETTTGGARLAGNANIWQNLERMQGGISLGGRASAVDTLLQIAPIVKFRVNLQSIQNIEIVGPATNARTTSVPVLQSAATRTSLQEITIPGVMTRLKHGDEFVLEGQLAARTEANHTTGVISDYTSTPLMIVKRYARP